MENENRNGQEPYYSEKSETFYESEKREYEERQSQYQQPQYQWQPYTSGSYNLNGQGTGGDAPLDKNGNPMKNRFGLKLTASIFEMLACNLISLICGIIGCIFTVKANKAYEERRWDDFKSARKASAVSLWIGFGSIVLYVILVIIIVIFAYTYDELDMDSYYEDSYYDIVSPDEDFTDDIAESEESLKDLLGTENIIYEDENANSQNTESENTGDTGAVIPGEGFTTPEITIDGQLIELPLDYAELKEMGFSIDNEEYVVNIGEYEYPDLLNKDGDLIGYVYIANATEEPIACKDGVVFAIVLYLDEWQEVKADFELYNGITAETTEAEILEILGTPDYQESEDEDEYRYAFYEWYMHHPYFEDEVFNSIDFTYIDGYMYEMGIYYIGW